MQIDSIPGGLTTLADVQPGQVVEVYCMLPGCEGCPALRLTPLCAGSVVVCRDVSSDGIRIEVPDGRLFRVDMTCARRIQVERVFDGAEPRRPWRGRGRR